MLGYALWAAAAIAVLFLTFRFVRLFVVDEGYVGLLYRNGRLVTTLQPGLAIRAGWRLRLVPIDTRWQELMISSQEVLTADSVTLKLSLVAQQRIVDAEKSVREAQWWQQRVYTGAQIALREAIVRRTFDEVLAGRNELGHELGARITAEAAAVGVEVGSVAIRDIMLSAELRRAFAEAVRLREEGKAALEKARGETAALRSLANAARMLKDQPELLSVRLLQSIESVGANPGNTLVLGAPLEVLRLHAGGPLRRQGGDATE